MLAVIVSYLVRLLELVIIAHVLCRIFTALSPDSANIGPLC